MEDTSVGAGGGWTFHRRSGFILGIVAPDPGGSARFRLPNHLVFSQHLPYENGNSAEGKS